MYISTCLASDIHKGINVRLVVVDSHAGLVGSDGCHRCPGDVRLELSDSYMFNLLRFAVVGQDRHDILQRSFPNTCICIRSIVRKDFKFLTD